MWNKLKKNNFDEELFRVLETPVRRPNDKNIEYVYLSNGEVKRDKRGKKVRKRPYKYRYRPRPKQVKQEEDILNSESDNEKPPNIRTTN